MSTAQPPVRVLVVHSSAELYGSDRSLLDVVRLRPSHMQMCVVLPEPGPLEAPLRAAGAEVVIGDVCKVQRSMLSPRGLLQLPGTVRRTRRCLDALHHKHRFDLVYSNSLAVFGGALAAHRWRVPHVWHVREILTRSNLLSLAYRGVVRRLSSRVIANSAETLAWIAGGRQAGDRRYRTIWNGYDRPEVVPDRASSRQSLNVADDELLMVLVGRINAWKGQRLAVQAFAGLLAASPRHLRLAFVGSAFTGQAHFETELRQAIVATGTADRVDVHPFRADVEAVWQAADVVLVPSTEPEPFGRVAVEAMAFGKPVIAAAHGGLIEIVQHGCTGLLVEPRSVAALQDAMGRLADDGAFRARLGEAGRQRQLSEFSVVGYATRVAQVLMEAAASQ